MRNYLIMVEGPHDVAAVSRCIKLCGITREYTKQKEVPQLWQRLIPTRYPFDGENLDRIAQQPTFMGNEDISVAIKAARSDVQLLPELERICHELKIDEKAQISGVLLICDADQKTPSEKRDMILRKVEMNEEFCVEKQEDHFRLELDEIDAGERISIPMDIYVFPDNCNPGTLEDLLLEAAQTQFPELLDPATDYIEGVDRKTYTELKNLSERKKAIVGCICNVLRPGKANQIAVSDTKWISEDTIMCQGIRGLYEMIQKFLAN